ncbi:MAG: C39 family peptidase [Thermomicrobiales bacterium]
MFGTTEDYGVYNAPLAAALEAHGFSADAFYADGDRSALTSRIDAGKPVVVWVTYNLAMQERNIVEDDLGRYSLIPEQHAVLVYGYDDAGISVMDVGTGASATWDWDTFMASWSLFDGMGLAIDLQ